MNVTWKLTDENGNETDNKDSLWIAFDLDLKISKKIKTYSNSGEASSSPVASKLFGFPWVEEITVAPDALLIKRQDWVDFDIIADPLKELITEHFSGANGEIEENADPVLAPIENIDLTKYSENEAHIVKFLTEEVNPQVASHGGKISLVKLDGTDLHLKMEGGCQGCSMAAATLKDGVETSILERFNFVKQVIDTTDHGSGINPYL